jgi:phage protein D
MIGGGSRTALIWPTVKAGGRAMPSPVAQHLIRAVVDTHLHLPDMFELTFLDSHGTLVEDAGLAIGTAVEVESGSRDDTKAKSLIKGEVTSIEAVCADGVIYTVVRGYEKAHRLQRGRRTRTFLKMRDSDIASDIAKSAGLTVGKVDRSEVMHDHLAQVGQTDWDFLTQRAIEIGFETGVTGGEFFFRKAAGRKDESAFGGAMGAVAGMLGLGGGKLTFRDNLHTFLPRISAANLTPDVEVRVWDAKSARVAVGTSDAKTGTATIEDMEPADLATSFTDGLLPPLPKLPALPPIPGLPKIDFGTAASNTAFVVVNHPMANGSNADIAAEEAAIGIADHIASTFAEAEGDANGDPAIQAGAQVEIDGVPKQFVGTWTVTNARHIFDPEEGGYHTKFFVSGRQNRNLFALMSGSATSVQNPVLNGFVCGIVTNANDPASMGRVKVALPWLSPDYESDWARVAQLGAGRRSGMFFLPEVGDEVLIGFEFGDARRPYVVGGLLNDGASYEPMSDAVNGSGSIVKRGIASPAGNRLLFNDDLPPGPPGSLPPIASSIALGTKDDKLALNIDQAAGTVTLTCNPSPPVSKTPAGSLTIECGGLGSITIKGGAGGIKIESDGQLELSGKLGVKIDSPAITEIKGSVVKLN